jgi:hypothetical protein
MDALLLREELLSKLTLLLEETLDEELLSKLTLLLEETFEEEIPLAELELLGVSSLVAIFVNENCIITPLR